jgi:hypothetical protein
MEASSLSSKPSLALLPFQLRQEALAFSWLDPDGDSDEEHVNPSQIVACAIRAAATTFSKEPERGFERPLPSAATTAR